MTLQIYSADFALRSQIRQQLMEEYQMPTEFYNPYLNSSASLSDSQDSLSIQSHPEDEQELDTGDDDHYHRSITTTASLNRSQRLILKKWKKVKCASRRAVKRVSALFDVPPESLDHRRSTPSSSLHEAEWDEDAALLLNEA